MRNVFAAVFVQLSLCLFCPSQSLFAQSSFNLEFIDDYPIKIDGGCSFFTYDTTDLARSKYVFVVSANKNAFFKKDGKIVIVDRLNRKLKPNGYVDNFQGSGYRITIDVNKTKKNERGGTEVAGTLKISYRTSVKTIAVKGLNEEFEINR